MTPRDSTVRLPSWLIAASLAVVVIATLTYFITTSNDNTDEATPPSDPPASSAAASDETTKEPAKDEDKSSKPDKKSKKPKKANNSSRSDKSSKPDNAKKSDQSQEKKRADKPSVSANATVDVYNNAGITNLAASASSDVRAAGFSIGGVDNWYGAIPSTTVYYPPGMEQQAKLLADNLGVGRVMQAVDPMSSERLSLILTAAI